MSHKKKNLWYSRPTSLGGGQARRFSGDSNTLVSKDGPFYREESPERVLSTRPEMSRGDSLGVVVIPEKTKLPQGLRKDSWIADNSKKRQTRDDKSWKKKYNATQGSSMISSPSNRRRTIKASPGKAERDKRKNEKFKQKMRNRQRDRKMENRHPTENIWSGKDVSPPLSPSARDRASSSWASIEVENGETAQFDLEAEKLILKNQNLKEIPQDIIKMTSLNHLDLRRNGICEFLHVRMIRALSGKLTKIKLRGNNITCLPADIKELKNLEWLDLGENDLREVPVEIAQLGSLSTLKLDGNPSLPSPLQECKSSEDVREYFSLLECSQKARDRHRHIAMLYQLDLQLKRSLEALVDTCRAENHGVRLLRGNISPDAAVADGRTLVNVADTTSNLWDLCRTCRPKGIEIMNSMGQYEYCDVVAVFDAARRQGSHKTLSAMREIQSVQQSVRLQSIVPIEYFEEVREVIAKKHPRVLSFSGHSDISNMQFNTRAGRNVQPGADMFVEVLRDAPSRLKCVFLNGCKTKRIAKQIVEELPHLTVICWTTVVEDKAALRFLAGFYDYLGKILNEVQLERKPIDLDAAFDAGVAEFERCRYCPSPLKTPFDWFSFYQRSLPEMQYVQESEREGHILNEWVNRCKKGFKQHFVEVAQKNADASEHVCNFAQYYILPGDTREGEGHHTVAMCRYWVGDPEVYSKGPHVYHNDSAIGTVKRCLACHPPCHGIPAIVRGKSQASRKRSYRCGRKGVRIREAVGHNFAGNERPKHARMPWD